MVNTVVIAGHLGKDPEVKTTSGGTSVVSFDLAVRRGYVKSGEERKTDWIPCVAWRKTADYIAQYLHKGSHIAVTGAIQCREYVDKDGKNRKAVEVIVSEVTSLDKRESNSDNADWSAPAPVMGYTAGSQEDFSSVDSDDDLPF